MRTVVQRVSEAGVTVLGGERIGIGSGLLVLVGVCKEDKEDAARWMAEKILGLRVFEDDGGKLNLSVQDVMGEILVISQFTLYGDCRKGRRPSFDKAERPDEAERLYLLFAEYLAQSGLTVKKGSFGAMMDIDSINHGPVTLIVDSPK